MDSTLETGFLEDSFAPAAGMDLGLDDDIDKGPGLGGGGHDPLGDGISIFGSTSPKTLSHTLVTGTRGSLYFFSKS